MQSVEEVTAQCVLAAGLPKVLLRPRAVAQVQTEKLRLQRRLQGGKIDGGRLTRQLDAAAAALELRRQGRADGGKRIISGRDGKALIAPRPAGHEFRAAGALFGRNEQSSPQRKASMARAMVEE